ncbi:hypothetical protein B0H34DRAFT_791245 [Crassisporium funariophilum]|nr:hypothetical protein B0H34DRAFT_791245 [Crassisporium funariophilum]
MKPLNSFLISSFFLLLFSHNANADIHRRQPPILQPPPAASSTTTTEVSSTTTTSLPPTSTTSVPTTSNTTPPTTTSTTTAPPSTTTTPPPSTPTTTADPVLTTVNGIEVTVTVIGSSTTPTPQPTESKKSDSSEGGGLGTGSIVGMSVAGGVAVIGIIAFFVWKFTRKRFSDFDDGEAIKWPDLNTHGGSASDSHPLPVHNTGRAGFDTGSDSSLSRVNSSNNYSTADFNSGASSDPYAVPPLPHLNPNQPYRDDPGAMGGYYDPYRGPIPGTMEQSAVGGQEWGGEAIPMNQMNAPGRMSPGPNAAYVGEPVYDAGRQSPGPQAAYGGRVSPGPQAAYGGRMSPGPHAAYGGAVSPAPPVGYDAYGQGRM